MKNELEILSLRYDELLTFDAGICETNLSAIFAKKLLNLLGTSEDSTICPFSIILMLFVRRFFLIVLLIISHVFFIFPLLSLNSS